MKLLVAISILCCSLIAYGQQRSGEGALRVMSFNIRYDEPRDGVNAWSNRKQKVADVIRFHKADLVGVQEALPTQLADLEKLLPDFAWCGVGRSDGKESGEYSAILYHKSRFELQECKTFWLSETPDKPGSVGWDAALPRIVTWAKFKDRVASKTFYHFNTHFDHRGEKARTESASLILKKIGEIAGKSPFFLTGDLNVEESSDAYKTLKSGNSTTQLADAKYASVNGYFGGDSTFNEFKELQPGRKIDYIFVREGIRVVEHGALSDRWNGLWASDHLPVIAEIIIR
ncbi:MAG TPA: endonuclease/exonuclease/phosphatase family protein [Pyrinomonadaceae bacterium]|nr:endonuclease/exonuclease/phosphatase family protein [Pyrinomonadaceae bacterium]